MVDTVSIGGIKLSEELVQVDIFGGPVPDDNLLNLLEQVSSAKINIPHLHQGRAGREVCTSLCLSSIDHQRLQVAIAREMSSVRWRTKLSIATLSLFPHRFDIGFFGRLMECFQEHGIPLHGLTSSISALIVHTDFIQIDKAAEMVQTFAQLPENHTPLRPVVLLDGEEVETSASYWESTIRIYGMDVEEDLCGVRFGYSPEKGKPQDWQRLNSCGKFRQVTLYSNEQQLYCQLITKRDGHGEVVKILREMVAGQGDAYFDIMEGISMISFHGPHFQDRFGIVEKTMAQLREDGQIIFSCNCAGTTVQLLVPQENVIAVRESLAKAFVVPT